MTYKITVEYARATELTTLSDGVKLAATRFQLLKADDSTVVATVDIDTGALTHDFTGIEDQSLIAAVQDLDGSGNLLGDVFKSDAFTPSAIVPVAAAQYAAIASVKVSAVSE